MRLALLPLSRRFSLSLGAFALWQNLSSVSVSCSARTVVDVTVDSATELFIDVDEEVDIYDDGECGLESEGEDSVNEKECGYELRTVDRPSAMLISPSINYSERDDNHQHFNIISFQRLPAAVHQSIRLPRPQVVVT